MCKKIFVILTMMLTFVLVSTVGIAQNLTKPIWRSPQDGTSTRNTMLPLGWSVVPHSTSYHLQVAKDLNFSDLEFDAEVPGEVFYPKKPFAIGVKFCRVKALANGISGPWSDSVTITIRPSPPSVQEISSKDLGIAPKIQHKDTAMLCLDGCKETGNHRWDGEHLNSGDSSKRDAHDNNYCVRASTSMIASYFGGNVSQDRISYYLFGSGVPEDDLGHGLGTSYAQYLDAISWACSGATVDGGITKPTFAQIKAWIDANRPLGIAINNSHAVVIDGYTKNGTDEIHVIDPWTGTEDSTIEYSTYNITGHYVAAAGSTGRNDEASISTDSDGDGIVDFDEINRFGTDPNNQYSDGDGIADKKEVRSYVFGNSPYKGPDVDGDGIRAELDVDGDDGGIEDGDEDTNANGQIDTDEKDPFLASDDTTSADVITVLDRSGSMRFYGYMEPAKNTAKMFVDFMNIDDQIGVVSFSSSSSVNYPLTIITGDAEKTAAKNAIGSLSGNGMTSIGAGLGSARNQLSASGLSDHSWTMILLSDGYENTSPYVSSVLPTIPGKVTIHTIALGTNVDEALLSSIAQQTGGSYYVSPTPSELQGIYNNISGAVKNMNNVASVSGTIGNGQTESHEVGVDSSIGNAEFSIAWDSSSDQVSLTLTDPNGNTIDSSTAATDPDVTLISGDTYQTYQIATPPPGPWTLNVTGTSITASGDYFAAVRGTTDLRFTLVLDQLQYDKNESVKIVGSLLDNYQPLTGASVIAKVTLPGITGGIFGIQSQSEWIEKNGDTMPATAIVNSIGGAISELKLYDDGTHGDKHANDALYTNFFTGTDTSGSYAVKLLATGALGSTQFTREDSGSFYVTTTASADVTVDPTSVDLGTIQAGESATFDFEATSAGGLTIYTTASNLTNANNNVISAPALISTGTGMVPATYTATFSTPANAMGGTYTGKILAYTSAGSAEIQVTIQITPNQYPAGWNLISLSRTPNDTAIDQVLALIMGKVLSVWAYDSSSSSWKVYDPNNPGFSDLLTMGPGIGYWINASEDCVWNLP